MGNEVAIKAFGAVLEHPELVKEAFGCVSGLITQRVGADKEITLKKTEILPEVWKEQNRHEEVMFSEQRKLLEKFIDASMQKFNSKVDSLKNQQQSFDEFYHKELDLLVAHIAQLEDERTDAAGDKAQYLRLSEEITKLEDAKLELKREYTKNSQYLTDAIKVLEVEMQFSQPMEQLGQVQLPYQKNMLLGEF